MIACLAGSMLIAAAGLSGCSGCRSDSSAAAKKKQEEDEKQKKKKLEKPKPDYEVTKLRTFPDDPSTVANYVKPGHWVSARQQFKANNFNFSGDLESATVDRDDKMIDIERTDFHLTGSRKLQLPKGNSKDAELLYHIPRRTVSPAGIVRNVWLRTRLLTARGGREALPPTREGTAIMPEYQFYMVVLAKDVDSYGFVKKLESVAAPRNDLNQNLRLYYRVIMPVIDTASETAIPLSSNALTWTSVACLWWDEVQPASLTIEQQQALLDWLQWGGQIIMSGPNSLDLLRGSFLEDYLPAQKVQTRELQQSDMSELDQQWSIASKRVNDLRRLDLVGLPLLGAELQKHPEANYLPGTGQLVVERRVGHGRIVVTAFPLNDRRIVNWKSYDNFVNACLLRRPGRTFESYDNNTVVHQTWRGLESQRWVEEDPRLSSTLRYFSRDVGYLDESSERAVFTAMAPAIRTERENAMRGFGTGSDGAQTPSQVGQHPASDDWHFDGYSYTPESGVAGWNDFSAASDAARRALNIAAGIKIPKADFILKIMAIYLVVLVPLNWLVFRLMGRVEWAWVAAPLVAIAGAVVVVRIAQLDIGFIRSRTEVAILEVQGGFPRAHLTRYSALYSSLSTAYDVGFEDPSAVALPFAGNEQQQKEFGSASNSVHFRNETRAVGDQRLVGELSGFLVDSNSTGMVHSEHMLSIGGSFRILGNDDSGWRLENQSDLALRGAGILRVRETGEAEVAWVGDLAPKTTASVRFKMRGADWRYFEEWEVSPATKHSDEDISGEINLAGLFDLAMRKLKMRRGDCRLIAWVDDDFEGLRFEPSASQTAFRGMVLCHLARGPLPAPESDTNCSLDVKDPPAEDQSEITNTNDATVQPNASP